MVWAVATAGGEGQTVAQQTAATLRALESNLIAAGASKHTIVDATVYLSDIAKKAEMDTVWNDWIPPGAWPCRACVGVDLAPGDLVEVKVSALAE